MRELTVSNNYFCLIFIIFLAVIPDQFTSVQIPIKIIMYKSGILR